MTITFVENDPKIIYITDSVDCFCGDQNELNGQADRERENEHSKIWIDYTLNHLNWKIVSESQADRKATKVFTYRFGLTKGHFIGMSK